MVENYGAIAGQKRKIGADYKESPPSKKQHTVARSGDAPIERLPTEVIERTATFLHSDDPIATRDDQVNFQHTSKLIRNVVAGLPSSEPSGKIDGGSPALKLFNGRLKRLGTLALTTMRDAVPASGLPDEASAGMGRHLRRGDPVAARDIVDAIGPLFPFQKGEVANRLINDVGDFNLNLSDTPAEVLQSLAKNSHGLSPQYRREVGRHAAAIFTRRGPINTEERGLAAEALTHLGINGHLHDDLKNYVALKVNRRSDLAPLLGIAWRDIRAEQAGRSIESGVTGVQPEGVSSLDERITRLELMAREAREAMVLTEHGRLDHHEEIGREVPKLYNEARDALIHSGRDDRTRGDDRSI